MDMKTFLDFAIDVALEAGKKIKEASELVKQIETKENSADLVTKTDKAVEDYVFSRLKGRFPSHTLIGEESALLGTINQLGMEPTWIVDPIDGTTNFVHGFPFFCVSIGLAIEGGPVVGVVYNPILGQLYYASKGDGSFLKQGSIETILSSKAQRLGNNAQELPQRLSQALLSTEYGAAKTNDYLLPKIEMIQTFLAEPIAGRGVRSVGSAALSMCLIAQGAVDVYYEQGVHAWDVCAGAIIVEEAGGIVRGWNQDAFDVLDRTAVCIRPSSDYKGKRNPPLLTELLSILKPMSYPRD